MRGRGIAIVDASRHPDYREGEIVAANLGWQDYAILSPDARLTMDVSAVLNPSEPRLPLTALLGVLGPNGMTAWQGLMRTARMRAGDTVLVSSAAGGVGSGTVQVAKLSGGRVIGIAGGAEKCAWVRDYLGANHVIDYKSENLDSRLSELAPDGIDVFFDNVGGETLDTALNHLAFGARIAICGYISTQYAAQKLPGPSNYGMLLHQAASMAGFRIWDHMDEFPLMESRLARWFDQGRLKPAEDVLDGLDSMPQALAGMFTGAAKGSRVVRVSADPDRFTQT